MGDGQPKAEGKPTSRTCPTCGNPYPPYVARCPDDGTMLRDKMPEPDPEPNTIAGTTIENRYYVGELIGKGAMGRVYRGVQLSVGRQVAIKVLRKNLSSDEDVRQRFLREAKIISDFTHPNIVRLIDFGDARGLLYIVMEYIEGVPLQRIIRGRPVRLEFAFEVLTQLCGPLIEAHEGGVVHRDLKPDNVFVVRGSDDSLRVKVLDFGIARIDQPMEGVAGDLTGQGMVFGTPEYMSPEQARGDSVDKAADMYAAGVLLYELVTGDLPIQGLSPMETMVMQVQNAPPDVRDKVEHVPDQVADLIHRLLVKDPAERLSDARELKRSLEEMRRDLEIGPITELPDGDVGLVLEQQFIYAPGNVPTPIELPALPPDFRRGAEGADGGEGVEEADRPTVLGAASPAMESSDTPWVAILYAIASAMLLLAVLIATLVFGF